MRTEQPSENNYPQVDQFTGAELRDHVFDGIQEYDNNLPLWWQAILYISIVAAILYVAWYHFGPGQLGAERLEGQLAIVRQERLDALAAMGEINEDTLRAFLTDSSRISKGRAVYEAQGCAQCHGANGLGVTAPNLRDDYWKWGSNMMDIHTTISEGRSQTAMVAVNASPEDLISLTVFLVHWNKTEKANGRGVRIDGEVLSPIEY